MASSKNSPSTKKTPAQRSAARKQESEPITEAEVARIQSALTSGALTIEIVEGRAIVRRVKKTALAAKKAPTKKAAAAKKAPNVTAGPKTGDWPGPRGPRRA